MNIILFDVVKFGVPTLSAIVTANLFLSTVKNAFLGDTTTMVLAVLVLVFASADTICNPTEKKRMAFKTANRLANLEEVLRLRLSVPPDPNVRVKELENASDQLRQILDDYADGGW